MVCGKAGQMAMIDVGQCKGKHVYLKKEPRDRSEDLKKPENRQFSRFLGVRMT